VIALHSPDGVIETGLLVCPLEKKAAKPACSIEQDTFLRSGLGVRVAELRQFSAIFGAMRLDFSALQTVWRREWDSNLALNPKLLITDFKRLA
jgi:hypothetical protein